MNTKQYQEKEKESQAIIDLFYKEKGWNFNRDFACREYDLIFYFDFSNIKVEEKFRYNNYDDFLIEILQDVITVNKGWYYETKADNIFYVVNDEFLYSVNWGKFKNWFKNEYKKIKMKPVISVEGFGLTINIAIKWNQIPEEYYKKFKIL